MQKNLDFHLQVRTHSFKNEAFEPDLDDGVGAQKSGICTKMANS